MPKLYGVLILLCLNGISIPLIVIDWSDLTRDRKWQLILASVAIEGRNMTLYEEISGDFTVSASGVSTQLATMLSSGCAPILITDACFRGTWFKLGQRMHSKQSLKVPVRNVSRGCSII